MSSSENKNCSSISSIHLLELLIMVVIGGFFVVWPLAMIGWRWRCGVQNRPRRIRNWMDLYTPSFKAINATEAELSLTLRTWFLCVTHTQWPCLGLFSVPVVPLWCVHVLVIDWEKTFAELEKSHLMLPVFELQYTQTYKTHSGCVGRSWQQCSWAQTMCPGLFSCSSVLTKAWLWHPPCW